MASINLSNLELVLAQKSVAATDSYQMLIYSKALEQSKSSVAYTVDTFIELPASSEWVGYLFWVVELQQMYYSDPDFGWVNVDNSNPVNNELWTWGFNSSGQLGTGTTVSRSSPGTTAGGGTTWCQVNAGNAHTVAIKTDGTLWTWGGNTTGILGTGTTVSRSSPGTTAGGGTTWCQVSAFNAHTVAIKTDGTLWTWGCNNAGQLGTGTIVSRSSPGTTAGGGTTWCQVNAGNEHNAAIKTDGSLWTWGSGAVGRLGDNSIVNRSSPGTTAGGGTTWCQVSSSNHTAAVKTDGTLWTWGENASGRLGNNSTVNISSPGTTAGGGTTWCQVNAGNEHNAAIKTDGSLWTWGCNGTGRLGDNTVLNRSSPGTTAGGGTTWCQVSIACASSAAIKTDGTLWTWGCNATGQLGTGTTVSRSSPGTTAGGGTTWCQVSAACLHTNAITSISKL